MSPPAFQRIRAAALILAALLGGPPACGPGVTRLELDTAQSRVDSARSRLTMMEKELAELQAELQKMKTFGGPDHLNKIKAAGALRVEKTELEGVLAQLNSRLDHFTKEAARHREILSREKQP